MKKFLTVITVIVVIAILILLAFNINDGVKLTNVNNDSQTIVDNSKDIIENKEDTNVLEQINTAQVIQVREEIISFNKEYAIYIDGNEIATVSGKYVNITGDVFTLKDNNGNILASEKQIKRWGIKLNRLAKLMDENSDVIGYIGEDIINDLFSLSKYKFHFYDKNKNEYAYTKEKILSLLYEFEVYNLDDIQVYKIEQDFNLLTDSYNITKLDESEVSMEKVIFLTCIVDAIRDAQE